MGKYVTYNSKVDKTKEPEVFNLNSYLTEIAKQRRGFADESIPYLKVMDIAGRCKNRMDLSFYKYGSARDNFASGRVDAIGCVDLCLEKFRKTKNTEYLHDAINYLVFRILFPMPDEYFRATDSGESAGVDGTPINMEREV